MKTCADCLHYDLCNELNGVEYPGPCDYFFKDKNKFLELPCSVGDTLYDIYEAANNKGYEDEVIKELKVPEIRINLDKRNRPWLIISNYMFAFEDFGKTVFLSREEAEKKLEKLT